MGGVTPARSGAAAAFGSALGEREAATLAWACAFALMTTALLWPALSNRFPVIFYDTGGYLMAAIDGTLVNGRSALYGAFLALGIPLDFWPNVIAQAAATAWIVILTLRVHGFRRPWLAAMLIMGLAVFTSLPWYAAQLMPDVLVPAATLALYLLAFRSALLRRWEILSLAAIIAFAMASHMSILALALGLIACGAALALVATRMRWTRPNVALPAITVIALALLSNLALAGRLAFTPGGTSFVFGRLVQDGIVARYLDDMCPDETIRLCAYRDELPGTADEWLWDPSPLAKLGGWDAYEDEARRIIIDTLQRYPGMHVKSAIAATLAQFVQAQTGDGLTPWQWTTHWAIEIKAPNAYPKLMAARQQQEDYDFPSNFAWLNYAHVPVLALSFIALPILLVGGRVRRPAKTLCATVLLALIGNAAICGVFSNPHDRYQSRLAPLAPLAVAIAMLGVRPQRRAIPVLSSAAVRPG